MHVITAQHPLNQPPTNAQNFSLDFSARVAGEQPRLVRLCAYLSGDRQAAEDLAQETLLIAWRQQHRLTDPSGFAHWLNAIARNVCRHHLRGQRRAHTHLALPTERQGFDTGCDTAIETTPSTNLADDFDLEVELERAELIRLLDRAMGLLPPETRGLLVQHYLEELPQAELVAKTGLSSSALAVRLHRGKLALRHALTNDLSDEAIALGLVAPEAAGWQATRIWCFNCGQHFMLAQFNQAEGHLRLRCPACCNPHDPNDVFSNSQMPSLSKFRAYKPAYSTVLKFIYDYYIEGAQAGMVACYQCGQPLPIRNGSAPGCPAGADDIYAWCERCQAVAGLETWWSLTQSLPQVRHFWQEHPRMRSLPTQRRTIADTPAVCTGYESVPDGQRIEVAFTANTFEVIYVERKQ